MGAGGIYWVLCWVFDILNSHIRCAICVPYMFVFNSEMQVINSIMNEEQPSNENQKDIITRMNRE